MGDASTANKDSPSLPTPTKNQIIEMYQRLNNELRGIQERVFDLQNKAEEHDLVAKQIEPLPGDRKCCRLIRGVLVERTVAQVLPVVKENATGLHEVRIECLAPCCSADARAHVPSQTLTSSEPTLCVATCHATLSARA